MTSTLDRLLPRQADNRFQAHRAALWLLELFINLGLMALLALGLLLSLVPRRRKPS